MSGKPGVVGAFLPALCSLLIQAGCATRPAPAASGRSLNYGVTVVWDSESAPPQLTIAHWLQNLGDKPVAFEFRNSGRVCGLIRDPGGEKVLHFPEITAQVMGTEKLNPGEERTYEHRVPKRELGEPSLALSA